MRYGLGVAVFVKVVVQCISTVPVETSTCAIHVHVVSVWQYLLRSADLLHNIVVCLQDSCVHVYIYIYIHYV